MEALKNNKHALAAEKVSIWLFALMLIALNLPNFIWLQSSEGLWINLAGYIERILLGLLLGACFLCCFNKVWQAWLLLWLLFLWWLPLALGMRVIVGTPITITLIGAAVATSPAELRELLSSIPSVWFVFLFVWNALCWLMVRWLRAKSAWCWGWRFRSKTICLSLCMLLIPHVLLSYLSAASIGVNSSVPATKTLASNNADSLESQLREFDKDLQDQQLGFSYRLADMFPYELPWAVLQYKQARSAVYAIRTNLQAPDLAYSMTGHTPAADVVVLVIGESSTRNAWHWFNPNAPASTSQLEARLGRGEHLYGFSRTLAQAVATRHAVPSMLTAQPLVWPSGAPNSRATFSIVSVAEEAGYATAWFSNQAAAGKHDGVIASYAEEAATTAFLNPSSFNARGSYDEVLLPALKRHLALHQQAFVVLHTMGSHFNYFHRYPAEFGPFPNTNNLREAYFNSVAYTDHFLDSVIELLNQNGRKAVLVYASDHGESIPSGTCAAETTNRQTHDAYEVPALVWLSDTYVQANPAVTRQLEANTSLPYSVAAVSQTLLDLMRGNTDVELPISTTQSFLRNNIVKNKKGQNVEPAFALKFSQAVDKNPCSVILN